MSVLEEFYGSDDNPNYEKEQKAKLVAGVPLARLKEICAAERDGRCVVLPKSPCQIGDQVFVIDTWSNKPYLFRTTVKEIKKEDGRILCAEGVDVWFYRFPSDFGKTVFLTRAEAEAQMNGEKT